MFTTFSMQSSNQKCREESVCVFFSVFCYNGQITDNFIFEILKMFLKIQKTPSFVLKHGVFLAGALGLEPRAYGFGDRRSTN